MRTTPALRLTRPRWAEPTSEEMASLSCVFEGIAPSDLHDRRAPHEVQSYHSLMTQAHDGLELWVSLGPLLAEWVEAAEKRLVESYRFKLEKLIDAAGITDPDHPLRAAARELKPDLADSEFLIYASCGMDDVLRGQAERARLVGALREQWAEIQDDYEYCLGDEEEDDVDVWAAFWEGFDTLSPRTPDGALAALAHLPNQAVAALSDRSSLWPMDLLGATEAEILGQALTQVAERASVDPHQLPTAPVRLDEPAMCFTDGAEACRVVWDWILEREVWARVGGALLPVVGHTRA